MEQKAFALLHEAESSWWYRGRARVARAALHRVRAPHGGRILDLGAGFGGMREVLGEDGAEVVGFEPEVSAREVAATRGYTAMHSTLNEALAHSYSLVALFDVIEHVSDDGSLLKQVRDALAPGGHIILTTPAFPFLWSKHDVSHHHYRRYTKQGLRTLLVQSGYEVELLSFWNFFLFPLAVLVRLLGLSGEGSFKEGLVSSLSLWLVQLEAAWLAIASLPFGVSFVAVARKI